MSRPTSDPLPLALSVVVRVLEVVLCLPGPGCACRPPDGDLGTYDVVYLVTQGEFDAADMDADGSISEAECTTLCESGATAVECTYMAAEAVDTAAETGDGVGSVRCAFDRDYACE